MSMKEIEKKNIQI